MPRGMPRLVFFRSCADRVDVAEQFPKKFSGSARSLGRQPDRVDWVMRARSQIALCVEPLEGIIVESRIGLNAGLARQFAEVKAFAGDDVYFVCNPLARHGNAVGNWAALIDSEGDFVQQQQLVRSYSESGGPLTLDRIGLCGYSVSGVGIGPYGDYMTCAYTWKTNGLLGNVRSRSLREAYEFKARVERDHYARYGRSPCLVRDVSFDLYLHGLEGEKRPSATGGEYSQKSETLQSGA